MEKKYEFTGLDRRVSVSGRYVVVSRIRAVRSFGSVKKGEAGGWIGMEYNLSHDGNAWVKDNAVVIDDSVVCGNVLVSGSALIAEGSEISGNAVVCGDAMVTAAKISGNARVCGYAEINPGAEVTDNAVVCDYARIEFDTCIYGNAKVCGYGQIPAYVGTGGNTVVNKVNEFDIGFGNEAVDRFHQDAVKINYLRSVVNYWIFAGLPPYGFEKKDFSSPLEFRNAVEDFILNDNKKFKDAMLAYYCTEEPDCLCDWIDHDEYDTSQINLPARLFYQPAGWKGRRTADPAISKENALREVKRNGLLLRWVKEQTPEICMAAVKQNGEALQWVKEQTPEMCAAAMLENPNAEKYAEWKPEYKEPEADENGFVSFNELIDAEAESIKAGRLVKMCN